LTELAVDARLTLTDVAVDALPAILTRDTTRD